VTEDVETVKLALACPAAMVTDAGTVATTELLNSLTKAPPIAAGPLRLAVPVDTAPPATALGLSVTDCSVTGSIVRPAYLTTPSKLAVIVSAVSILTDEL
jgi:hypothetical protein